MEKHHIDKIREWHQLVVLGLVNGLSFTVKDGRTDDINFWRKRCDLFNAFSLAIMDIIWVNDYTINETNLKEIAEEGYKR